MDISKPTIFKLYDNSVMEYYPKFLNKIESDEYFKDFSKLNFAENYFTVSSWQNIKIPRLQCWCNFNDINKPNSYGLYSREKPIKMTIELKN